MWLKDVMNEMVVSCTYGGGLPLNPLYVQRLSLNENGPTLNVSADLPAYPDSPPEKWARQGYNSCLIELNFIGVGDLAITGFSTSNVCTLTTERKSDSEIVFKLSSDGALKVSGVCCAIHVQSVKGYAREI